MVRSSDRAGDPLRGLGSGALFGYLNAGKRSLELDLASPAGHETALSLVGAADVVVENLRAGGLERLGLGPAELAKVSPVHALVRISNFARAGRSRNLPVTDGVATANDGRTRRRSRAPRSIMRRSWRRRSSRSRRWILMTTSSPVVGTAACTWA